MQKGHLWLQLPLYPTHLPHHGGSACNLGDSRCGGGASHSSTFGSDTRERSDTSSSKAPVISEAKAIDTEGTGDTSGRSSVGQKVLILKYTQK